MRDDIAELLEQLRSSDESTALQAYRKLRDEAKLDPSGILPELCREVSIEGATGRRAVLQLLLIVAALGSTDLHCIAAAREILSGPSDEVASLVGLAAGALVARAEPAALMPHPDTIKRAGDDEIEALSQVARAVPILLNASAHMLARAEHDDITVMARELLRDLAAHDLMTFSDHVAMWIELVDEQSTLVDVILDCLVRLSNQLRGQREAKAYVLRVLVDLGLEGEAVETMGVTVAAAALTEGLNDAAPPQPAAQSTTEPPEPDPIVDELLVPFEFGDENSMELARVMLEQHLNERSKPDPIYWIAATIDAMEPARRQTEIEWLIYSLIQTNSSLEGPFLAQWLDEPLLLDANVTPVALILLGRTQPGVVAKSFMERAIEVSQTSHPEILVGELWRAIVRAAPVSALRLVDRWYALDMPASAFREMLEAKIAETSRWDRDAASALVTELPSLDHIPDHLARQIDPTSED